jgi:hypothetical protein
MELRAMIPNPPTIGKIGFFQFGDSNKSEPATPSDPDPSVARGLKEISLRLGVVFVAGLVI